MNRLRALGAMSIGLFVLGGALGSAPGRTAPGGATGGIIALLCWLAAIVVAIVSFLASVRSTAPQDRLTLVLARGPLVLLGGALLAGLVVATSRG